ncbi:MAG: cell division protein FtsK [Candidatus Desulforudis sp.]|nr:cell division protein FtsK [Desulforudis sp.]
MQKTNALGESFQSIRYLWRHRKGQEVPAAVLDVLDALYADKTKPLLIRKIKKENGWRLIFNIPPGVSFNELKRKHDYFTDATNAVVLFEKINGHLHLEMQTAELKDHYPYAWNPEQYPKLHLPLPVGYTPSGLGVADLAAMPHLLIAGHPGAGKSNYLHTVVASLLLLPKPVYVCVVDFKKLEFAYLKQRALVVTDMENARNLLTALNREMDSRLDALEKAGVVKIQDFQGEMPFIVLVIDELAEMIDEHCQSQLNRILRLSRAAGICVVCATQRPSSTIFAKFGDSKAMFAANLCFKVRDEINSRMVLDNDRAAHLPQIPGRGVFQWEDETEVQSMFLPVNQAKKMLSKIQSRQVSRLERQAKRLPPR